LGTTKHALILLLLSDLVDELLLDVAHLLSLLLNNPFVVTVLQSCLCISNTPSHLAKVVVRGRNLRKHLRIKVTICKILLLVYSGHLKRLLLRHEVVAHLIFGVLLLSYTAIMMILGLLSVHLKTMHSVIGRVRTLFDKLRD